jgi:hypothetical protein
MELSGTDGRGELARRPGTLRLVSRNDPNEWQ